MTATIGTPKPVGYAGPDAPGPWRVEEAPGPRQPIWFIRDAHGWLVAAVYDRQLAQQLATWPNLVQCCETVAQWLRMREQHYRSLGSQDVAAGLGNNALVLEAALALTKVQQP